MKLLKISNIILPVPGGGGRIMKNINPVMCCGFIKMSIFRIHSVRMTSASKSGHPTSCSSMAEIISVLFFKVMKYKVAEPKAASNDRQVSF